MHFKKNIRFLIMTTITYNTTLVPDRLKACLKYLNFCINNLLQLKYDPNLINYSEIFVLSEPNTKHTKNYMYTECLQSHQTILYFLDEMNFALLFQYCMLAPDYSQCPHLNYKPNTKKYQYHQK